VATNRNPVRGLKVREGHFIPTWVVIGEYTGTVMNRGKRKNIHSHYIVEIGQEFMPVSFLVDPIISQTHLYYT